MGSEYITRLVFDLEAETVVLLHKGKPMGGICGRIFQKEMFMEIAFCAVSTTLQMSGYGKLSMNYLKTVLQADELYDILTCADNAAVQYFQKQGFNDKVIDMDPNRWKRRIKDYEKVTLVHCKLYPDVDYMQFTKTIDEQIKFLEEKIGNRRFQPLFPDDSYWLPFEQSPTFLNKHMEEIVMDNKNFNRDKYKEEMKELRNKLLEIIDELKKDDRFIDFSTPVTEKIAPEYFKKISNPMDLRTIERRLLRFPDYYKSVQTFETDISLIVNNCKNYNSPETVFYKAAIQLAEKVASLLYDKFGYKS